MKCLVVEEELVGQREREGERERHQLWQLEPSLPPSPIQLSPFHSVKDGFQLGGEGGAGSPP